MIAALEETCNLDGMPDELPLDRGQDVLPALDRSECLAL